MGEVLLSRAFEVLVCSVWTGINAEHRGSEEAWLAAGIGVSANTGETLGRAGSCLCPWPSGGEALLPTRLAGAIPLKCGIQCPLLEEGQIWVSG